MLPKSFGDRTFIIWRTCPGSIELCAWDVEHMEFCEEWAREGDITEGYRKIA